MLFRLLIISVCLLALPFTGHAQRKRAFMVGISNYRVNGYKVWDNIHGAEDVQLLTPELKKKGFKVQSLTNEAATYKGITTALKRFIANSKKGDIVYMHFSCHGQPVEDGLLEGFPKDEKDGWDESLVPIDAGKVYGIRGYKGENHITDDELYGYIMRLRKAIGPKGCVCVVIDACHAGDMERGDFGSIRGTNEGFTQYAWNKYNPSKTGSYRKIVKSADLAPVLYVEACEAYEKNQEIKYGKKDYGALSFNVWQMINVYKSFPAGIKDFKSRLLLNVNGNRDKRNRLWPGTQTLVFKD